MPSSKKIIISGTVQGVGFRPFVWRTAVKNNIKGFVSNTSAGVFIKAEGENKDLKSFVEDLRKQAPPASKISSFEISDLKYEGLKNFYIKKSKESKTISASVPADLAICKACAEDIKDSKNRRYEYPFTNCTDCGPRFTIVEKLPYDRPFTSMKKFKMCPSCFKEYKDPSNRRFHAQPNACPVCGPKVFLWEKGKIACENKEAIEKAADNIISGNILAIKGLGGFHLACDPFNFKAVKRLRDFKDRPFKPFALMTDDLNTVNKYLHISKKEEEIVFSSKAPIVTLKKKKNNYFNYVSPNLDSVGVMSAYTPLHLVLFKILREKKFLSPLIMTSGNHRDEPITKDNEEAVKLFSSLGPILLHNRPIHNRIDDSLVYVDEFSQERIIRRARGYVPDFISLPFSAKEDIFASGADIKNSFAFTRKKELFVSQYIGDLDDRNNSNFFCETYKKTKKLLKANPASAVCDFHPGYRSSSLAYSLGFKPCFVQHHIAHFFSVMAEHSILNDCIGVSVDGTGYGTDGKIWGCEFFVYKNNKVYRKASLEEFCLPGGEICLLEPYRILVSLAYKFGLGENLNKVFKLKEKEVMEKMIENKINSPLTTSAGRLFDAFSCLILDKKYSTYEAQLPMEAESICPKISSVEPYSFEIVKDKDILRICPKEALTRAFKDKKNNTSQDIMSYKFHFGFASAVSEICLLLAKENKINNICFSGGCFQNRKFSYFLTNILKNKKLNLYFNSKLPSNDGCISAGQIYFKLLKATIA
ncbi:MAG: carbamoyltransferase HypF [Elusimicrobiota bacterium]